MRKIIIALAVILTSAFAQAQSMWNAEHLAEVKSQLNRPYYAAAYTSLIKDADKLLSAKPLSVMDKPSAPASGDKHDYMSLARYGWPDSTKNDGLPYINRDGLTNPEMKKYDRIPLGNTCSRIKTLSLAWYFSGQEKYAAKADELIRVWFLDKATAMNPNLEYAQVMRGHNNDKGRASGLIDSYSLVDMVNAAELLEKSKSFPAKDSNALKKWVSELTEWMLSSKQGIAEGNATNNHSVAYDAQIVSFALFTGNRKLAEKVIRELPERRLFAQIEPDGKQPRELKRTRAYHYSWYNLTHFVDIMLMAKNMGCDIANVTSPDGRNILKAYDFLTPYISSGKESWPYKEIGNWNDVKQNICLDLYRIGMYLNPERKDYINVYDANRVLNPADQFNLLYVKPNAIDDAFAHAAAQLRYASECADREKQTEERKARNQIIPRSINADGSLAMVRPRDWCSGFFSGSLWQVYGYTHNEEWRRLADKWTWPIEEMKNCRETHDLGFVINDSFGKGLEQTGDSRYRDVVVQAAKSLSTRFNPAVGCIRSWDHHADVWPYPVIIDNMMNLEMLFSATQLTGDPAFRDIAISHADKTMQNHFRQDFSSCHVVNYDAATGKATGQYTHQGYSDDSVWSRGQGWGLYGYTMCYRFTKDEKYLRQGEKIADYILSLPNMPADCVPYWDMKMPGVTDQTPENVNPSIPRDASAAAVIASGLYELSGYVGAEKGAKYRSYADRIVDSLSGNYQCAPGTNYGFVLLHSTGNHPAGGEIDVPINYADYYYLEALTRKRELDSAL